MYPFFQFPNSLKEFIKRCLLFRSDDRFHWFLGCLGWAGIFLLTYAIYHLINLVIHD